MARFTAVSPVVGDGSAVLGAVVAALVLSAAARDIYLRTLGRRRDRALDRGGHPIARIPTSGRTRTMPSARHPRRIVLEPGGAAVFELNTGTAANYSRSACRPRKAGTLMISVPSSGPAARPIAYGMELCSTGGNASAGPIE